MGYINPRRDLRPKVPAPTSTPAIPSKPPSGLPEQPPESDSPDIAKPVPVRLYSRQRAKVGRLAKRWGLTEIGVSATIRRMIDEFPES